MTKAEKRVLAALQAQGGPPEEIARSVGMSHAQVLTVLASLEARRLVHQRRVVVFESVANT